MMRYQANRSVARLIIFPRVPRWPQIHNVPGFEGLTISDKAAQPDAQMSPVEEAERAWKVAMEEKEKGIREMTLEKEKALGGS